MLSWEFGYTRTETGREREQKWGFYPRVSRFKTHFFLLQCMTQFYVRESSVFFVGNIGSLSALMLSVYNSQGQRYISTNI